MSDGGVHVRAGATTIDINQDGVVDIARDDGTTITIGGTTIQLGAPDGAPLAMSWLIEAWATAARAHMATLEQ